MEKIKQQDFLPFWSLVILIPSLLSAFPVALSAFGLIFMAYRYFQPGFPQRSLWKLSGLALTVLAVVWISNRTMLSLESGISLLFGLSCIKINDIKTEGDKKIIALLLILLASLAPLYKLDLVSLVSAFLSVFFVWSYLLPENFEAKWKYFAKILLYSVPLVLILFIVFPRIVVPWSKTAASGGGGSIGFSDNFNPSQVQELAVQEGTAFTVKINGLPMDTSQMYWRGAVLNSQQGLAWSEGSHANGVKAPNSTVQTEVSATIAYDVYLDHDFSGRAFLLDAPLSLLAEDKILELSVNSEGALSKDRFINKYSARSLSESFLNDPPTPQQLKYLAIGKKLSAIMENIKERYSKPKDRITALTNFFANLDLEYTLKPGAFTENTIEELLYKKRKGFCGHFASAFATLARAVDVPSRLVTGFQGATYNPYGDFYKVENKDAHAWVEVYLNGWRRIDPTNWIAPSRISLGAQAFMDLPEESRNSRKAISRSSIDDDSIFEHISFWVQDFEFRWSSFILNYDSETQKDLIKALLSPSISARDAILLVTALLSFLTIRSLRRKKVYDSEKEKIFFGIEELFLRKGLRKKFSEPPLSFLRRCRDFLEEKSYPKNVLAFFDSYLSHYEKSTYSPSQGPIAWDHLEKKWNIVKSFIASKKDTTNDKRNNSEISNT